MLFRMALALIKSEKSRREMSEDQKETPLIYKLVCLLTPSENEQNYKFALQCANDCLIKRELAYSPFLTFPCCVHRGRLVQMYEGNYDFLRTAMATQKFDKLVVYTNLGITPDMRKVIDASPIPIEYRKLPDVFYQHI